jgi:lysozyme
MPNWPGDDAVFPLVEPDIKNFEGYSAAPYPDQKGVPTIGWGTIAYPDGQAVTMQDPPIAPDYAEQCLDYEMSQKSAAISGHFTRMPSIHQAAAMLSLAYNIGVGAFLTSTVLRQFNAGNMQAAADAFLLWDKITVNNVLVFDQGLLNRREAERTIFLTPDA